MAAASFVKRCHIPTCCQQSRHHIRSPPGSIYGGHDRSLEGCTRFFDQGGQAELKRTGPSCIGIGVHR